MSLQINYTTSIPTSLEASGTIEGVDGPIDGIQVDLWNSSRFSTPPQLGDPVPNDNLPADAGPVTSGIQYGSHGAWRIPVSQAETYYVRAYYQGVNYWQVNNDALILGADEAGSAANVQANLNTEITRAEAAEAGLQTQISAEVIRATSAESLLAPKSNPTFTGHVTVPTGTNSTDAVNLGQLPHFTFINVLDHGIVADAAFGSGTDNAAAINALIQSSSTPEGAVIYFPAVNTNSSFNNGNTSYGIKSAIELTKDVTLVGDNNGIVMFNALPGFTDTAMLRTFSSTDYKTLVTDTGCTLTNDSKVVLDSNASNTYIGSLITSTTPGIPLNTQIAACTPGVSYTMVNAFIGTTTSSASVSTGGKSIYAPATLTSSTNNLEPKVQNLTFNFNNRCNNTVAIQIAQINERGCFQNVTVENYEYQTFAQAQLGKINYGLIGVAIWGGVGRSIFDHLTCYGYGFQNEIVMDATNGGCTVSFMADIYITNYTSAPRIPDGLGHGGSVVYARAVNALYINGHMESMAPNNALPSTWPSGSTPTTWQANTAYTLNQPIVYNGFVYWAARAGTTGSTIPSSFSVGTWQPNTTYSLNQIISAGQGTPYYFKATSITTGITDSTLPNFSGYSSPIKDGGVTWTRGSGLTFNDPDSNGVQWQYKGQVPYIPNTSWTPNTYVTSTTDTNNGGTTLQPGGANSPYLYSCIQDSKTGSVQPTWPNILGAQVWDGDPVTAVSLSGTTLNLSSVSGFSTSGVGTLTHSGVTKTFSYTGISGSALTGVSWVGGTPTVSNGDSVLVPVVWQCVSVDCNNSASIQMIDCPDPKINVVFKGDQSTAILRPVVRSTVTTGFNDTFTANTNPIGSPVLDHCQVSTQTHNKFLGNFIEDYTGGLTRVMSYSPQTMDPYWISYDGVSYVYANRPTPETATAIVTKQFATSFSMGGNKITNVANGTNPGDAVNFSQLSAVGAIVPASLNVKSCITTAAINSGTAYTSISIAACPQPMNSGSQLNLLLYSAGAVTTQTVTLSSAVTAGATSISVNSFTPSSTFPIGTELVLLSATLPINTLFPGATKLKVTVVGSGAGGGGAGGATGTTLQAGAGGGAMGSWTEQILSVGSATTMTSVRIGAGGYGGTSGSPGNAGGSGGAGSTSSAILNGVTVSSGGGGNGAGSNGNSTSNAGGGIWGRQGNSTTLNAFSGGISGTAGSIAVGYSGGSGAGGGAATSTTGGGGGASGLGVSTTGVPSAGTAGGSGSGSTGANGGTAAINSAAGGGGGGGGAAGTGSGGVGGIGGSGYLVIEVVG